MIRPLPPVTAWLFLLVISSTVVVVSCGGGGSSTQSGGSTQPGAFSGVLQWKGDTSGKGLYPNELNLTPANVNSAQFGKLGTFQADGLVAAQPLYVRGVDMGAAGTHDLVIVATEHDSVYAIDPSNPGAGPLWQRHYVDPTNGVTTLPDIFGGRSTFDGEVGITGTPFVDSSTGAIYFVTTLSRNGTAEQWLRALDIRTGNDFGPGNVMIQASVPGDGRGSVNGQIAFDPAVQNQRAGLTSVNGSILVAWGSFSDWGIYHGWLMAFDPATLKLRAAFNPTTQFQAIDPAGGPSDHGGGGSFWQGGAAPAVDSAGYIYLNAADGSFNADQGGNNYGDTLLKLKFTGTSFQIVDWFTPFNQACVDVADLELGSGGVAILPTDITGGTKLAAAINKEGRLFLVNTDTLGHYNASGDNQIVEEFMVGTQSCTSGTDSTAAEGPGWNRLYGNVSYWNGNLYAGASNLNLKQYQFQNGLPNPTPVAQSPTAYGLRGANTVVSANGNQSGIVWAYEKAATSQAILHAYDANSVSTELWNSNQNSSRDAMGVGTSFASPVVIGGRVIVTFDTVVAFYGLLP